MDPGKTQTRCGGRDDQCYTGEYISSASRGLCENPARLPFPSAAQKTAISTGMGIKGRPVTKGYAVAGGSVFMLMTEATTFGKLAALVPYDIPAIKKSATPARV